MLDNEFKKSATEKLKSMDSNEFKKAFKEIGSEPETNEEWFCQLSTEEKVSALLNLHEKVKQRMRTDIGGENSFYKGDYYREWLKQPHRGGEK